MLNEKRILLLQIMKYINCARSLEGMSFNIHSEQAETALFTIYTYL